MMPDFAAIGLALGIWARETFGLAYGLAGLVWPIWLGIGVLIGWHMAGCRP